MNKEEISLSTLAYLIGHYKTHEETIINSQEIEAINFILDENEQLQQELNQKSKIIEEIKEYVNFLVIFNQNINGKFSETQWGEDILGIIEELEKGSEE